MNLIRKKNKYKTLKGHSLNQKPFVPCYLQTVITLLLTLIQTHTDTHTHTLTQNHSRPKYTWVVFLKLIIY